MCCFLPPRWNTLRFNHSTVKTTIAHNNFWHCRVSFSLFVKPGSHMPLTYLGPSLQSIASACARYINKVKRKWGEKWLCTREISSSSAILCKLAWDMAASMAWRNVVTYVNIYCWHIICPRHWSLACLQSWTRINFAGKLVVNAWDRLCVGDKCSHMGQDCPRPCLRPCLR